MHTLLYWSVALTVLNLRPTHVPAAFMPGLSTLHISLSVLAYYWQAQSGILFIHNTALHSGSLPWLLPWSANCCTASQGGGCMISPPLHRLYMPLPAAWHPGSVRQTAFLCGLIGNLLMVWCRLCSSPPNKTLGRLK